MILVAVLLLTAALLAAVEYWDRKRRGLPPTSTKLELAKQHSAELERAAGLRFIEGYMLDGYWFLQSRRYITENGMEYHKTVLRHDGVDYDPDTLQPVKVDQPKRVPAYDWQPWQDEYMRSMQQSLERSALAGNVFPSPEQVYVLKKSSKYLP